MSEENTFLKNMLIKAISNPSDQEWQKEMLEYLNKPTDKKKEEKSANKWNGEACLTCKHSYNVHCNGGICCAANCSCDKFTSSGVDVAY